MAIASLNSLIFAQVVYGNTLTGFKPDKKLLVQIQPWEPYYLCLTRPKAESAPSSEEAEAEVNKE